MKEQSLKVCISDKIDNSTFKEILLESEPIKKCNFELKN